MTDYPQMGYYRHYKGQLYLVIGIADDSNADDLWSRSARDPASPLRHREVVVCVGLQFDGAKPGHRMKVRTVEHFMDERVPVGDNGFVRRYTYLGPVLTQEMIES